MALRGLALFLRDLGYLFVIGIGAGGAVGYVGFWIYDLIRGTG